MSYTIKQPTEQFLFFLKQAGVIYRYNGELFCFIPSPLFLLFRLAEFSQKQPQCFSCFFFFFWFSWALRFYFQIKIYFWLFFSVFSSQLHFYLHLTLPLPHFFTHTPIITTVSPPCITHPSTSSPDIANTFSKIVFRDFPGSPLVKTPRFHCGGHGFHPWLGN